MHDQTAKTTTTTTTTKRYMYPCEQRPELLGDVLEQGNRISEAVNDRGQRVLLSGKLCLAQHTSRTGNCAVDKPKTNK